jgi:hypothetical protein
MQHRTAARKTAAWKSKFPRLKASKSFKNALKNDRFGSAGAVFYCDAFICIRAMGRRFSRIGFLLNSFPSCFNLKCLF